MEDSGVSSSTFSMTDFAGSGGGARMSVGPGIIHRSHHSLLCSVVARFESQHVPWTIIQAPGLTHDEVVKDAMS